MEIKTKRILLIGVWAVFLVIIPIIDLITPAGTAMQFMVRLFALYGYFMMSMAAAMTPFLKDIMKVFGKPFLKIHHVFAIAGLIFITLHPIFLAIIRMNLAVFIPDFSSWRTFWVLAGRPALILIYIGFIAALLRMKMKNLWRPIHGLMYVALFFGIIHANLIGTNLIEILAVRILFNILFAMVVIAFILKKRQQSQQKKATLLRKSKPAPPIDLNK